MTTRLQGIRLLTLAGAFCLVLCARVLPADSPGDAVAPYVDDQTFAIGRLDVSQIPLKDVLARATAFMKTVIKEPDVQGVIEAAFGQVSKLRSTFLRAGGKEVFLIVSMSDIPRNPPFFVVTCSDPQKINGLKTFVTQLSAGARPPVHVEMANERVLLVATEPTIERLKVLKSEPRAEVLAAWKAAEQSPIQLLITPSEDQRRVMLETFPELPAPWEQITGETLSEGIQWGVLTLEAAPRLQARLLVESKNTQAASRLAKIVTSSLNALGEWPQMRKMVPQAAQLLGLIKPVVNGSRVSITLTEDQETLNAIMKPLAEAVTAARKSARRMQSANNLKQIGLAMHNHYDVHKRFPLAASVDESGKPLLSWRVYILPFVEQVELYKQFKLDEPWDSEHNKKLIALIPQTYVDPNVKLKPGTTTYVAVTGKGTIFGGKESLGFPDIRDGTSNTVMIVSAHPDNAVIWTKPDDLPVTQENPLEGLTGKGRTSFEALFCDGSVRTLTDAIDKKTLWQLFDANDGQVIDNNKIK